METDKEVKAISEILSAMEGLDAPARERVLKYVLERLGSSVSLVNISTIGAPAENPIQPNPAVVSPSPLGNDPARIVDIRTLKDQKNPASAIQMATLVAYYLQDVAPIAERKGVIGTADIEKYFKQASFRLPAGKNRAADTLNNAKRAGYLETVGQGEYKLNPVGYNLIAHGLTGVASKNGTKKKTAKKNKTQKANKKR